MNALHSFSQEWSTSSLTYSQATQTNISEVAQCQTNTDAKLEEKQLLC